MPERLNGGGHGGQGRGDQLEGGGRQPAITAQAARSQSVSGVRARGSGPTGRSGPPPAGPARTRPPLRGGRVPPVDRRSVRLGPAAAEPLPMSSASAEPGQPLVQRPSRLAHRAPPSARRSGPPGMVSIVGPTPSCRRRGVHAADRSDGDPPPSTGRWAWPREQWTPLVGVRPGRTCSGGRRVAETLFAMMEEPAGEQVARRLPERGAGSAHAGRSRTGGRGAGRPAPARGQATVRTVAVNAVMAGARRGLPVIVAGPCGPQRPAQPAERPGHHARRGHHGRRAPRHRPERRVQRRRHVRTGLAGQRHHRPAIRLILLHVAGGYPGDGDAWTQGQPAKYGFCFAENMAASPGRPTPGASASTPPAR